MLERRYWNGTLGWEDLALSFFVVHFFGSSFLGTWLTHPLLFWTFSCTFAYIPPSCVEGILTATRYHIIRFVFFLDYLLRYTLSCHLTVGSLTFTYTRGGRIPHFRGGKTPVLVLLLIWRSGKFDTCFSSYTAFPVSMNFALT